MARAGSSGRRSSPGRRDEVARGRIQADARRRVYFSFTARLRPRRPTPRACCPNGSSSAACRIRPVRRFVRFAPSRSPRLKAMYFSRQRIELPRKSQLREEAELAAVLLGGAYEVLANLAVRADLLAEVGDDLRHGGDTSQRGSSISVRPRRVRRGWTGARVGHAPPRVQGRGI